VLCTKGKLNILVYVPCNFTVRMLTSNVAFIDRHLGATL
jgi:hypothetical protein